MTEILQQILQQDIKTSFSNQIFLPIHQDDMIKKISIDEKKVCLDFIKQNFGKIPQRKMARELGIGKTTVNTWSAQMGLKHKKHTVNEIFFDAFDEKMAYILGFIYADGNIAWNPKKGYQSLTITAAAKDKNHFF